jgi:competence protein ComEC
MPQILVMLAAAFAAGVAIAGLYQGPLAVLYGLAAVLSGLAVWLVRRQSSLVVVAALALFVVAGLLRAEEAGRPSPLDVGRFADKQVTVYGTVAAAPQVWDIDQETVKVKYIVAMTAVAGEGRGLTAADGAVAIHIRQPRLAPLAAYGDRATASGLLRAAEGYKNPGRPSGPREISARLTARPGDFSFSPADGRPWAAVIAGWRSAVTAMIAGSMAPDDAAILSGILFGGYSGIRQEVVRDFAATGIVHILSVSGTHIALAAGVVVWLGGRLGLHRGRTAALAAVAVSFYSLFAGLAPPVVRALIMGLAALAAVGLGRNKDAGHALALAVLAMLVYQPALLYDISFQLSCGATAGLVYLYPPLAARLSFLPAWLAGPLAVTAAAQLAVLPFLAWYFNSFPVSAFIANIVIVPLIEAVLVVGLAASLTVFLLPALGKLLLIGCALVIGLTVNLAGWLAALPGSSIYLPTLGFAAGTVYYLALGWVYGFLPRLPGPLAVWRRWPKPTAAAAALFIIAACVYAYYPRPLSVHFIDVGQGDATLVVTPHGRAVLVDAGGSGGLSDFDVGQRVVLPYLRHYGVTSLDYLVLTHGHVDHAGGAAAVAAAMPVKTLLLPAEGFTAAVQVLLRTGGEAILAAAGQRITLDGVSFQVVYSAADARPGRRGEASTVVRVDYGNHGFLITGDLGNEEERALAGRLTAGSVLKVSHHGARTATTPELLAAYRPAYAVISAGYGNRFGHPHAETLARLQAAGTAIYRTDRGGAVVFRSDGETLTALPFRKAGK